MTDVAAQSSEFAAALAGLRGYIESHGDGDTAVMGSLDALIAERDNLDDNLARVQRHLQHAVAESRRERARADQAEAALQAIIDLRIDENASRVISRIEKRAGRRET